MKNKSLLSILIFTIAMGCKAPLANNTSGLGSVADGELSETDLLASLREQPCDTIKWKSYTYPNGLYTYDNGGASGKTSGYADDKLPSGIKSLEFQEYEPGAKIKLVPLTGEESGKADTWILYRVSKAQMLIKKTTQKTKHQGGKGSTPLSVGEPTIDVHPDYEFYAKTRKAQDISFFKSFRDSGVVSPYLTRKSKQQTNVRYSYEYFNYEVCTPTLVVSAPHHNPDFNVKNYCRERLGSQDYSNPGTKPDCLGYHFAGQKYEIDSYLKKLDFYENTITFIGQATPIVGTVMKGIECKESGSPKCWVEAGAYAVSDLIIIAPFIKGTAATTKAALETQKKLLLLNVGLNVGLAADDVIRDKDYTSALARLGMAGISYVEFRWVKSKHQSSLTYRNPAARALAGNSSKLSKYADDILSKLRIGASSAVKLSVDHQDDVIRSLARIVTGDEAVLLKYSIAISDVGKSPAAQSILKEASKDSDILISVLQGRPVSGYQNASSALKEVLTESGLGGRTLLNPNLTAQEIRMVFNAKTALPGYLHELPGMIDPIKRFAAGEITKKQFMDVVKGNLFHNGPAEGFWKLLTDDYIPKGLQKLKEEGMVAAGKFFDGTVFQNGSRLQYPIPAFRSSILHTTADRMSQGTKGGVLKIFEEIVGFTKSHDIVRELLLTNPSNTILQLKALKAARPSYAATIDEAIRRVDKFATTVRNNVQQVSDGYIVNGVRITEMTEKSETLRVIEGLMNKVEAVTGDPMRVL